MNNIYSTLLISLGLLCLFFLTTSCSKKGFVKVNTNEIILTLKSPEAELLITYSGEFDIEVEGDIRFAGGGIHNEWFYVILKGFIGGRPPDEQPWTNPVVFLVRLQEDITITSAKSATVRIISEGNTEVVTVRFVPE
jgi:hypothetical protein